MQGPASPVDDQNRDLGLLIIGHGTRDPAGRDEFAELVRQVELFVPRVLVQGCFLELAEPDIADGLDRLRSRGAQRITALPLLLCAAGHVKSDIPAQLAAAVRRCGIDESCVRQASHLGCRTPIIELSRRRYDEALLGRARVPAQETALLLVGRGSRDPEATAEFCHFARQRWDRSQAGWLETGFLAMALPAFSQALESVARLPVARIVVQPHLLFSGDLRGGLAQTVLDAASKYPGRELVLTAPLGADALLAQAVIAIADLQPTKDITELSRGAKGRC